MASHESQLPVGTRYIERGLDWIVEQIKIVTCQKIIRTRKGWKLARAVDMAQKRSMNAWISII